MTLEETDALCHAVAHGDRVHGEHGLGAETALLHVPRWRGVGGFGLALPETQSCWEETPLFFCLLGTSENLLYGSGE